MDEAVIGESCQGQSEQRRQHPSVSACLITSLDGFHYCTTYWTLPFICIREVQGNKFYTFWVMYYKQEAAMSNRAHIFSVNNIYLILGVLVATNNNVTSSFGAVKVYPSLMAFIIKYQLGETAIRIGHCVDISSKEMCSITGGIKYRGFSYDTG
ncbi:hypothetical protein O0I10_002479 [Lichtheimia ornata]|uniref:Uncharacterized protein n=1 Tax=Lichtheimia ornata TaxID=688661 RepID=A0AAD7Y2P3_9FUNG|nr:uncharacterized protein O0I10_002479 [Lichtheimia ornata]KAJ8661672.1 hypothetical protein O0I10_002479 [Lichtheimia ornata]